MYVVNTDFPFAKIKIDAGWRHYYDVKSVTQQFLWFLIFKAKNVHPIRKEQLYLPVFSPHISWVLRTLPWKHLWQSNYRCTCEHAHRNRFIASSFSDYFVPSSLSYGFEDIWY